jgi:hypothetical protein
MHVLQQTAPPFPESTRYWRLATSYRANAALTKRVACLRLPLRLPACHLRSGVMQQVQLPSTEEDQLTSPPRARLEALTDLRHDPGQPGLWIRPGRSTRRLALAKHSASVKNCNAANI